MKLQPLKVRNLVFGRVTDGMAQPSEANSDISCSSGDVRGANSPFRGTSGKRGLPTIKRANGMRGLWP